MKNFKEIKAKVESIFCFVDDFLVIRSYKKIAAFSEVVLTYYKLTGDGLNIACQVPIENKLQFYI